MVQFANPIYDTIFKYLMEDERVARTILSVLLKKEVLSVEQRRNEYSNVTRDSLSVFRIDFGALVREEDGTEHFVLIELQKTWLETETLRFRQYLGAHYSNPENIKKDDRNGYALPMVAIYILGHRVGDIDVPVIYVNRNVCDYEGNEVTQGVPDPFVDSLTHESVIVQIPCLRDVIKNERLKKIMNFFDQTNKNQNQHLLTIDESIFNGDEEMLRILHRLTAAAADSQIRHEMNVEDEYFSAIEKRDTEILMRDKQLAEQKTQLDEQKTQLDEQKTQLDEQKTQLAASINFMLSQNISKEDIAKAMGLSMSQIESMIS